jgi:DNA-binding beta-propeller fold protein YncE
MRWGIRFVLLASFLGLVLPGSAGAFGPLSSFGDFGRGAGQLDSPAQMAVAANGDLYVADRGNDRIAVFSGDGGFQRAFGSAVAPGGGNVCTTMCQAGTGGELAGQMREPNDVSLGADGRVFVADQLNNRIDVFSAEGTFLFAFGKDVGSGTNVCVAVCKKGAAEAAAGAIANPAGVFADGSRVYVANAEFSRIDVFSGAGPFLYGFGKEVNASDDSDVCDAVDGCQDAAHSGPGAMFTPLDVTIGSDGDVYVADFGNGRIDVFSKQGAFIRSFGEAGAGALDGPVSLTTDGAGQVYVADQLAQRVELFSSSGSSAGGFPAEPGVAGVGVACKGNVFAAEEDTLFARVVRFGELGTPPPPCVEPPQPDLIVDPGVKFPSNKFHFAGLVKNRGNGFAVLYVRVPGPGKLSLNGRGFRRLSRTARRAMKVRLPIKPKVRLRHFLAQHGKGRIRVAVTFTPTGGVPRTLEKVVVLKRHRG